MRFNICLIVMLMLLSVLESGAENYKYINSKGVVCFTDDIKNVPEDCRKSAVLLENDLGNDKISTAPVLVPEAREEPKPVTVIETARKPYAPVQDRRPETGRNPYVNLGILSAMFMATLIPGFFVNNKVFKMILRASSIASILSILFYAYVIFGARQLHAMKKEANKAVSIIEKKEADKQRAAQDLGEENISAREGEQLTDASAQPR